MSRRRPKRPPACHTPGKAIFISRACAQSAADHAAFGTPLRPYRCDCGAWHLTSHFRQEQTA